MYVLNLSKLFLTCSIYLIKVYKKKKKKKKANPKIRQVKSSNTPTTILMQNGKTYQECRGFKIVRSLIRITVRFRVRIRVRFWMGIGTRVVWGLGLALCGIIVGELWSRLGSGLDLGSV